MQRAWWWIVACAVFVVGTYYLNEQLFNDHPAPSAEAARPLVSNEEPLTAEEYKAAEMAAYFLRNYFQKVLGVKDRFQFRVDPKNADVIRDVSGVWRVTGHYTAPPEYDDDIFYTATLAGPDSNGKWRLQTMSAAGGVIFEDGRWRR